MLDSPTNTRVLPISGMIFIGKWRYPPTFFRDHFPIYLIFFFERHPLQTSSSSRQCQDYFMAVKRLLQGLFSTASPFFHILEKYSSNVNLLILFQDYHNISFHQTFSSISYLLSLALLSSGLLLFLI